MRTLIVQSNGNLCRIWKAHLERLGAEVSIAVDGHEAIALLEMADFDVIVLDLMLEEGNALSVADMASFRHPESNIVFVTDSTFFSDGSIFAHSRNARAIMQSKTPPRDLAQIVYHYGQGVSRDHEVPVDPVAD